MLILLITVMVIVSACGNSKGEVDNGEKKKDPEAPLKFAWFYNQPVTKAIKNIGESEGIKEIMKRFNAEIDFQTPAAEAGQQFNIMLATGEYPEVINWQLNGYPGGLAKLVSDGVAIKLNDLIEDHAPNFKKLLDENPELRKQVTLDDGTIALFPKIELDLTRMAYEGNLIRQDWLDKLNLDVPATIEEWYEVLKAFKEKDPNGNQLQDEIPLALNKDNSSLYNFAGAWGVRAKNFYISPNSGVMTYGPLEKNYLDYISTMHKWYVEGLIDSEFASLDDKAVDSRIAENRVGAIRGLVSYFGKWAQLMRAEVPEFQWVGTTEAVGVGGKPYNSTQDMAIHIATQNGTFITSAAKEPERIVAFLDYLYGEEGGTLINWGIEGKSYIIEDGVKKFTDEMKNSNGTINYEVLNKYAYTQWGFSKVMNKEAWAQVELTSPDAKNANELWGTSDKALLLPPLTFTPEESQEYAKIMSEVNTYFDEMFTKFVMGIESLDRFDQFIKTLKDMGIEKAIKIQQGAYDRYESK